MEASPFYRIQFLQYLKLGNHIEYKIRLICIEDISNYVDFQERYKNLKKLHDIFKKEAKSTNFPKFPPKKFFGNQEEKFLNQRQTSLQHYFNSVQKNYNKLSSLKRWINQILIKNGKRPIKHQIKENEKIVLLNENDRISSPQIKTKNSLHQNITYSTVNTTNPFRSTTNLIESRKTESKTELIKDYQEIIEKFSRNFLDLGAENLCLPDNEELYRREKKYKKCFLKESCFKKSEIVSSKLLKLPEGSDENFSILGKNENFTEKELIISNELQNLEKNISCTIPHEYIIESLIVSI
jgi:hypothetical protein